MQTDCGECRHFHAVCFKPYVAPLIEDTIEDIRNDEARIRSLRPPGGVIDLPSETYAQRLVREDILKNFVRGSPDRNRGLLFGVEANQGYGRFLYPDCPARPVH